MKTQRLYFRSRGMVFLWLLMLVVFAVPDDSFALDIYVSVDGDAQADGSLTKPYGSLPDAVEAVRALRKAGNTEPAVIVLRGGRHQLNQTLVLGLEDGSPTTSGDVTLEQYGAGDTTGPAFLTFAAYPGEHPVVSGGVPVTGWKRLESAPAELPAKAVGKVWVADMPTGMERFYTLYDSRGRLNRARNAGFAYAKPGNARTLHFPEGALKNWDNLEDVEIQVRPSRAWVINMLPLASVDEAAGVATTSVSATYQMGPLAPYLHNPEDSVVCVENILEALDEPGEWMVNTKTRKIYLWPSDPAPDGSPRGILAPTTTELIRVEGQIDYDGPTDTPVRGIAFSGLTFSHADRWAWTSDENRVGWGMQHDWDMFDRPTALLRFRGAEDCRVTDCKFVNSGGSGLRLDLHAQRNRITNCELAHLGEAGILLAGYGPGTKDVNHHNDIINNYIHHFSEITWHSPGLWAWQSGHNRMVHNELHHSGYSAVLITTRVSPGRGLNGEGGRTVRRHEIAQDSGARARGGYARWQRLEKYYHSRHNLFEYNEISHSVQLLSDGNAIYISGTGTGNIIRYNYLHDNRARSLPACIRCDDDQHETLIYGNVLYNNGGFTAGIVSKGINDIINNFIVAPAKVPKAGYISFAWVPATGAKAQRNIIMSHPEGGKAFAERLRRGTPPENGPKLVETDMDKNLYYHPTDSHWMDEHLLKMQAVGKEKASLFGDPLFVDPAGGDFRFRPDSPALTLGIEPLDVSKMGRLKRDKEREADPAQGETPDSLKLWYKQSAEAWTEALPIGNGRLGAMLFGGIEQEQLQLNEDTLWSGGPHCYDNPDAYQHLATVRELLEQEKYAEAESEAQKMLGIPKYQQAYMPLGDLFLDFGEEGESSEYRRELDLRNAVSTVTYRTGNAHFTRKTFASHPDQAIVMRLECDMPGQVTFDLSMTSPHASKSQTITGETLSMTGQLGPRKVSRLIGPWEGEGTGFAAQVKVAAEGGKVVAQGDKISVRHADAVTLVYVAATSYINYQDVSGDPLNKVDDYLAGIRGKSFEQLYQRHIDDYSELFDRVAINLGGKGANKNLPTDERLKRITQGSADPLLDEQLFQYGRYLMIAGSRLGTQPLNLQGIWNDKINPPWGSKYTININIQMNYWVAEACNLSECHEPLLRMVGELQAPGRNTAKVHYRAGGWVAHHNTDLWRGTAPVDGAQWGTWPTGGAWLCQHLWEHYLYTGDTEHLKKSYPILKGAVEFFLDALVENEDGHLITSPSISPEHSHGGGTKDGLSKGRSGTSVCAGPTIDMQILRDLFANCIAASEILDLDKNFRSQVTKTRARLAPMKIGRHGQLQEWLADWDNPKDKHSHVSHLYGLYPSSQINRRDTPKLFDAARTSLIQRGNAGGWPGAWRISLWARVGDGDRAHNVLNNHVMRRLNANLFNGGRRFQIDANFGATAGIAEMLLQSHGGEIHLLPALPKAWTTGSVKGLRARGGFEVDMEWKDGQLTEATIRANRDGAFRIYAQDILSKVISLKKGQSKVWPGTK